MKFTNLKTLLLAIIFLSCWVNIAIGQGKVRIIVSVDWEGDDLQTGNLKAMKNFRRDFPEIPLQQFLNAAYYTKSGADATQVTKAIKSVLLPKDEHGLHIHAWRTLVESSGVNFHINPSFVADEFMIADGVVA